MSLNIVLYEPEIPFNTGAISRTCALTHTKLHLIEPLGFSISDKAVKRAGLDYWPYVDLTVYKNYEEFLDKNREGRLFFASTKSSHIYTDVKYEDGDYLVFGPETRGLPEDVIFSDRGTNIRIPMIRELKRSLNLSNSVSIVLYEALRQVNFLDLV